MKKIFLSFCKTNKKYYKSTYSKIVFFEKNSIISTTGEGISDFMTSIFVTFRNFMKNIKKIIVVLLFAGVADGLAVQGFFGKYFNAQQLQGEPLQVVAHAVIIKIRDKDFDWEKIQNDLYVFAQDAQYHAIILDLDSSGGEIPYFAMLHTLIKDISKIKPVITSVKGKALSCGYMLASATDYILASPLSSVGSIGIYQQFEKYKGVSLDQDGLKVEKVTTYVFKGGKDKTVMHPYTPLLTNEEEQYLQDEINVLYKEFVDLIATDRNLNREESDVWANGKIFTGKEALKLGLIDELGTVFDVKNATLSIIKKRYESINFADTLQYSYVV